MTPLTKPAQRSAARLGFGTTTTVTIIQIVSQILAVAVLSRLLAPADFGATAAPIAIATGLAVFVEYGFGANVIQRRAEDDGFVGTAFTAVLCLSVVATAAMLAVAHLLGETLSATEPWMVELCAPLLLLLPIATFLESLLLRDLSYRTVFWANFVSTVLGQLAVPVGLALAGAGPTALILSQLSSPILKIVVMAQRSGVPQPRFDVGLLRQMLAFSTFFTLTRFFSFVALQGDRVVLSATTNDSAVGFYVRAQHFSQILITLLTSPLEKVLFPLLASMANDKDRVTALYLDTTKLIGIATGLVALGSAIYSELLIRVILGPQWQDAAPLAQIFSAMIMLRALDKAAAMLMRNERMVVERCLLQFGFALVTLISALLFGGVDFKLVAATIVVGAVVGQAYTIVVSSRFLAISLSAAAAPFAISLSVVGATALANLGFSTALNQLGVRGEYQKAAALGLAYLVIVAALWISRRQVLGPRLIEALTLPLRRKPD